MALFKKIDNLLIKNFIPPFIVTFWIAIFVLVMQTLWVYIEDIAGKGLGFGLLVELLAYRSVSLVPLALPLAVLISSVMVLGNLAERYELSSIKSAGVSLLRVMLPLMGIGFFIAWFSFYCAVSLIPMANLQFGSRMFDISQQKPTLRLQTGVFNDDFAGYSIKIGKKGSDGKSIEDVWVYDHREANLGRISAIVANEGEMFTTEDGKYFVMNLRDGHQYMETRPNGNSSYPLVRTNFEEWTKAFDLGEFQMKRTNPELFKHNRSMLSPKELADEADSLQLRIDKSYNQLSNTMANYFSKMEPDSSFLAQQAQTTKEVRTPAVDSLAARTKISEAIIAKKVKPKTDTSSYMARLKTEKQAEIERAERIKEDQRKNILPQVFSKGDSLQAYGSFLELFPKNHWSTLFRRAQSSARNIKGQAISSVAKIERLREDKVKHLYDLHTKYSMAVACFIFLFIGAPMGAIVRKGGFGYPILISIIFFMLFVVLTIFCRKIAESFIMPAELAAWLPCMVLFPIGIQLTRKAMNDSKMMNFDQYVAAVKSVFVRRKKTV